VLAEVDIVVSTVADRLPGVCLRSKALFPAVAADSLISTASDPLRELSPARKSMPPSSTSVGLGRKDGGIGMGEVARLLVAE
jgi:hypothetical protein